VSESVTSERVGKLTVDLRIHSSSYRLQTLAKFSLRRSQLRERVGQVFELIVELFLDLAQLLGCQAGEINWQHTSEELLRRQSRPPYPSVPSLTPSSTLTSVFRKGEFRSLSFLEQEVNLGAGSSFIKIKKGSRLITSPRLKSGVVLDDLFAEKSAAQQDE
jgi:hypothetical protein